MRRGNEPLGDETQQVFDDAGIERVDDELPLPLVADQFGGFEDVQMKAQRVGGHAQVLGQLPGVRGPGGQRQSISRRVGSARALKTPFNEDSQYVLRLFQYFNGY